MTFLYDKEFLNKLQSMADLKKTAQHEPELVTLRKKLVNNLDSNMNVSKSPEKVVSDPGADLKLSHLESLDSFLSFLHKNRVNFMNHDIVSANPESNDTERKEVKLSSLSTPVYVHSDALAGYLNHLGGIAKASSNKVMGSLLNKLIRELNHLLNKGAVSPVNVYYEGEFHEGAKLLNIPLNKLDPNTTGLKDLTIGDLKNKPAFNNWIQSNVKDVDLAYQNLNKFLTYLWSSLKTLANRASSVSLEELYKNGLQRLSNLASAFNITIGDDEEHSKPPVGSSKGNDSKAVGNILASLPFRNEDVSITRMEPFYNYLIDLHPKYKSFKNVAIKELNAAKALTANGLTTFPINGGHDQIRQSLKNPHNINDFYLYMQHIQKALMITFNALNDFRVYADSLIRDAKGHGKLLSQIGRSPTDFSVYSNNIHQINNIKKRFQSSIKTEQKK